MPTASRLISLDLWGEHERLCLSLVRRALADVATAAPIGATEPQLNRLLYRAVIRASQAIAAALPPPVVVPEGRNPPAATDEEYAAREAKIPDFYWAYIDPLAPDPNDAARQFVVECKRLTTPRSTWIYAEQYVIAGVARFVLPDYAYGKAMPSGAMIGYLQGMSVADALAAVNGYAIAESLPPLSLHSQDGDVSAELDHHLLRPFRESPFHLMHVWARV